MRPAYIEAEAVFCRKKQRRHPTICLFIFVYLFLPDLFVPYVDDLI